MRAVRRVVGAALGVTEQEVAAAFAYHAGQVRASGLLLLAVAAVVVVVVWAHSGDTWGRVPGPRPAPAPTVDFRP